jgi:hypothetical protein
MPSPLSTIIQMRGITMKLGINLISVVLALIGIIWFLQGIGVILGSFMSNTSQWTIIGLICIVIAVGLLIYNNRRKTQR